MDCSKRRKKESLGLKKKRIVPQILPDANRLTSLEAIEQIVILAENCELSENFFKKAGPYLKTVSDKQGITEIQALLLSLFVERSSSYHTTDLAEIAEIMNCRAISILKYQEQLDELVKTHFIKMKIDYHDHINYYVPKSVIKALSDDKRFEREPCKCNDNKEFLEKFLELTYALNRDEITHGIMYEEAKQLFDENFELPIVRDIRKLHLGQEDEMIITHLCRHTAIDNEDAISIDNIVYLIKEKSLRKELANKFAEGKHLLQKKKLVEYSFDDGFEDKSHFRLTPSAKTRLLKGFKLKPIKKGVSDIITSSNISEKALFYEGKTKDQVFELEGLLKEDNFKSIQARLKEQKLRCGFTCIFYGLPGTGKTETVYQLARKTGRSIIQVNIAEVKSCWVGESEKNIKGIFDRYRDKAKNSKITPILLFNEADAIISIRRERADRAVDKMENTIQNIILQEMETLDGIMIATTNLEQNMDAAFERRFLYKIKFNKPSIESRICIWQTLIPALSDDESAVLASKYDFSGGQIENIARHYAINKVLHGDEDDRLKCLISYCEEERFEKKHCQKIGFI